MSATGTSPVTASRCLLRRLDGGDQSPLRQPSAAQPVARPDVRRTAAATRRDASSSASRALEPHLRAGRATTCRKCTCESVKPGTTQRPPRSTRSGRGELALVRADAARDPLPRNRERARRREGGVERPDDAVLEDHGGSRDELAAKIELAVARRPPPRAFDGAARRAGRAGGGPRARARRGARR